MKNEKLRPWFTSLIFAAVGLIMFIIYCCTHTPVRVLTVLQFFSCMAVPFVIPVIGILVKREFSPSVAFNLGLLIFFGVYVERVFNVYEHFAAYDKILHTNFGFIGAAMVYSMLLRWRGDKMTTAGVLFTVILMTLGLGGAWELFEYSSAIFTGDDPQVWKAIVDEAIQSGAVTRNPLRDTMEDMMVTVIGASAFCLMYLTDCAAGLGAFKKLLGEPEKQGQMKRVKTPLEIQE